MLRGILTSKGEAWVEVKDDNGYLHRYLAPWNGDAPSKGGGFDAETLELIEELVVGNRVNLAWFWDGHLRLAAVEHEIPQDLTVEIHTNATSGPPKSRSRKP